MILETLQKRLIGAKLVDTEIYNGRGRQIQRLYIRYGINNRCYKSMCWFEVVNDRLTVFVRVETKNGKKSQGFDTNLAHRYKADIESQFYEIINDCEWERRQVPLHVRLRDDVPPISDDHCKLHQLGALRFMCSMKVSALFADAGVGKTKPVIHLCESRYVAGQINKVIVFCPVSTITNFERELTLWRSVPGLTWKIVGTESMSISAKTLFDALDFVDSETQVIIDESHQVKAPFAKRSKRLLLCASKTSYKVIITGTPTEHLKDLYMQFAMLSDLITECNNYYKFEEQYLLMGGPARDEVIGYKNLDYLMGLLEPYTYQLKLNECLDIPAKSFSDLECHLTDKQDEYYQYQKDSLLKLLARDEDIASHTIFGYLSRMQMIVCGFYKNNLSGQIEDLGTEKLGMLSETGYDKGQTIFYCKYLYEVEMLAKFLGPENCAVFTGRNKKKRYEEKDLFEHRKKKYFVATRSSGGVGLNGLQGCQRLVFFSGSYKSIERRQCIARIERFGQDKPMEIWEIYTIAGIDSKMRKCVARKEDLADEIRERLYDKTLLKQFVLEL